MNDGNSDDKQMSLYDVVPDNSVNIENDYIEKETKNHVWEVAKRVATEKEYKTLQLLLRDDLSRKEMAEQLNTTESAICRQRDRLIKKIQRYL